MKPSPQSRQWVCPSPPSFLISPYNPSLPPLRSCLLCAPGYHLSAFCHYRFICIFLEFYMNKSYHVSCVLVWLLSLSVIIWDRPCCQCICGSRLSVAESCFLVWIHHCLSSHLLCDGHLGCLRFLAVKNKISASSRVEVFVWTYDFLSIGKILRNGMAQSYGRHKFKFLWNCQTILWFWKETK